LAPLPLPRGALARLRRADPQLGRLIDRVGPFLLEAGARGGHLEALLRAIVYQQLSGKAAATIYGRFRALFPEGRFPTTEEILDVDDASLRACGLSGQKLSYVRDLCSRVESRELSLEGLDEQPDDEVVASLTQVHGFGRWSAEMFLIFHLGRLDVWPATDLGVRKALMALRGARELPAPAAALEAGDLYRPYRTVASWYLWKSLD
jgi:DNA-3-methyladenine glycosylase II